MKYLLSWICFLGFMNESLLAAVPREWEGKFVDAGIDFRLDKVESAQKKVEILLKNLPESVEILELSALIQKRRGNLEAALRTYGKLYQRVAGIEADKKKRFYAFEIGALHFLLNQLEEAKKFLNEAVEAKANESAAQFLLGRIAVRQNKWADSQEPFFGAGRSKLFKDLAEFQSAGAYFKEGRVFQAYEALIEAQESAKQKKTFSAQATSQMNSFSDRILSETQQALSPEDRPRWLKLIGLSTDYDSNVLTVPNTSDALASASSSSLKETLFLNLAYATSATQKNRYVVGYQGNMNYNFNKSTQLGQFMNHGLEVSWTRGFLNNWQYGVKVAGLGTFQFRSSAFRPYSLTGGLTVFMKKRVRPDYYAGVEGYWVPTKNYIDDTIASDSRRSGWAQLIRFYISGVKFRKYWNPSVNLLAGLNRSVGDKIKGHRLGFDISNFFVVNDKWSLIQGLGIGSIWYPKWSSGGRQDQTINALVRTEYFWDRSLSLAAQVDFLRSFSSESAYRYSRWVAGVSGSYLF